MLRATPFSRAVTLAVLALAATATLASAALRSPQVPFNSPPLQADFNTWDGAVNGLPDLLHAGRPQPRQQSPGADVQRHRRQLWRDVRLHAERSLQSRRQHVRPRRARAPVGLPDADPRLDVGHAQGDLPLDRRTRFE